MDWVADQMPSLDIYLHRDISIYQVTDSKLVCSPPPPLQHPSHTIHIPAVVSRVWYCVHYWLLGILPLLLGLLSALYLYLYILATF